MIKWTCIFFLLYAHMLNCIARMQKKTKYYCFKRCFFVCKKTLILFFSMFQIVWFCPFGSEIGLLIFRNLQWIIWHGLQLLWYLFKKYNWSLDKLHFTVFVFLCQTCFVFFTLCLFFDIVFNSCYFCFVLNQMFSISSNGFLCWFALFMAIRFQIASNIQKHLSIVYDHTNL